MSESQPSARKSIRTRVAVVLQAILLCGLIGLTAWRGLLARPALAEAREAFAKKDYMTALRRAQDDLDRFPRSREAKLIAARSLSLKIYADEAEPLYHEAAQARPLELSALQDRIQGLILSNRPDRAVAACHAALKRFPDDPTTLRYLATLEFALNHYALATEFAEKLSRTDEGRATGLALLREIYHETEKYEAAARAGEELVRIDPDLASLRYDHMTFWVELGDDLIQAGRFEAAKTLLGKVAEQSPNAAILDLLATAHFRLEQIEEAEQLWRRASAIDPHRVNPLLRLGLIEMGRRRYAEAAELLEKAVANDPKMLEPTYNLARAYRALGKTADAERLERTLEGIRKSLPPRRGGMGPSP